MPVAAQTRLYHPALAGTPPEEGNWNPLGGLFPTLLYHLGGSFQTPLYHLHPCRRERASCSAISILLQNQ